MSGTDTTMICASCSESVPTNTFCEACGEAVDTGPASTETELAARRCSACSATEVTADGWCSHCGQKQRPPQDHVPQDHVPEDHVPEDHVVDDHGHVAVVSDRGQRHRRNEDAGAVRLGSRRVVLVVCDGVSSTDSSQRAAHIAANTVADIIIHSNESDSVAIQTATAVAQQRVTELPAIDGGDPSSCTLVAAIASIEPQAQKVVLTVGWLGDSRAYWLDEDPAQGLGVTQLTVDHSWANEEQLHSRLSADEIAADSRAHSITQWLGADAGSIEPTVISVTVALPGRLLLCSDGLWNYAPTERSLAQIISRLNMAFGASAELAEALVSHANAAGGHDNITVAIAALSPQE